MKLFRVVDEIAHTLAIVFEEMFRRHLERLLNTLTNGDTRNDDNELAPAVSLVQFEHRFDVAVGLARSSLHLDVEIDRRHLVADKG